MITNPVPDFLPGDPIPAEWANAVNRALAALGQSTAPDVEITGPAGIQVPEAESDTLWAKILSVETGVANPQHDWVECWGPGPAVEVRPAGRSGGAGNNDPAYGVNGGIAAPGAVVLLRKDGTGTWKFDPPPLFVRVTGKTGSGVTAVYTGTVAYQTGPSNWADVSPAITVYRIGRPRYNVPSPMAGSAPPDIVVNQILAVVVDPAVAADGSGYPAYSVLYAVGSLYTIEIATGVCAGGVWTDYTDRITGPDLTYQRTGGSSPPPPPPPTTGAYYCVDGELVYVEPGGTVPPKFDCGPSSAKFDCATCSGSAVAPSGPLGIVDSTGYTDPYTVGDTVVLSLAKSGAVVGTATWHIYVIDDAANGSLVTSDTGTGNSFAPEVSLDRAGTVEFLVMLTDSGDASRLTLLTVSRTVDPPARDTKTGNYTAVVTDDLYQVIPVDASGGAVTVTLYTASGNGMAEVTVVKVDSSGNAVTVQAPGSELLRGSAGGSVTLTAQWQAKTFKNDNLDTHYDK